MATEPITIEIIFQLMLISLFLVIFGLGLNRILGIRQSKMKEIRNKATNLKERLHQAQLIGDTMLLQQLQLETMQLMKQMLKKQIIPMSIRCVIFITIFIFISMIYSKYEYWIWFYILFSFSFSISVMLLGRLYKKITGKEDKTKAFAKEIMGTIAPQQSMYMQGLNLPGHPMTEVQNSQATQEAPRLENENQETEKMEKVDAWKEKIQNKNQQ